MVLEITKKLKMQLQLNLINMVEEVLIQMRLYMIVAIIFPNQVEMLPI
ncbi:hypothetical protein SDC9_131013 [bioreactor metagenome]|uniref:Uncharacterized protein n=1 Tax=bioreactor metagenome TaxID=1076179 RepID=A0A645D4H5_9ZZZZ